jgi:hypothetical protein
LAATMPPWAGAPAFKAQSSFAYGVEGMCIRASWLSETCQKVMNRMRA